jgi:hypothetical protein
MPADQLTDTESVQDFMEDALEGVSGEELGAICKLLERKSTDFQSLLAEDAIDSLGESDIEWLLKSVFSTRRRAAKILEACGAGQIKEWIRDLLYGDGSVENRFETFCGLFDDVAENIRCDFAGELLHYTNPEKYWMWNRWMWDPRAKTGALPLVITDEYELESATLKESYLKVGRAVTFIRQTGDAAGFEMLGNSIFASDVYLSFVYVIYVYTTLRMRMTQEFNRVVPELSEFSRRLLGVYQYRT